MALPQIRGPGLAETIYISRAKRQGQRSDEAAAGPDSCHRCCGTQSVHHGEDAQHFPDRAAGIEEAMMKMFAVRSHDALAPLSSANDGHRCVECRNDHESQRDRESVSTISHVAGAERQCSQQIADRHAAGIAHED